MVSTAYGVAMRYANRQTAVNHVPVALPSCTLTALASLDTAALRPGNQFAASNLPRRVFGSNADRLRRAGR